MASLFIAVAVCVDLAVIVDQDREGACLLGHPSARAQIRTAVDRLSGMVDDLFDLSRIQAGSFSRDVGAIPLDDLVSDCMAALEPLAAAQGVRLVGRTAGSATVAGSAPELNRALTNLVANAIRHTPTDGRVDVLVGRRADDTAPVAEVVVEDQCGGIADDDLARVFDVGFRGEPARTPHAAGCGPPSCGRGR